MKRVLTVVGLSVAMLLSASMPAEVQSKKKGKEPELAISKRGKLIFEDDFSGKELEWNVGGGEWKISKGSLATKSSGVGSQVSINASFPSLKDFVFECKIWIPMNSMVFCQVGAGSGPTRPYVMIKHSGTALTASIITYDAAQVTEHTPRNIPYKKPTWLDVTFEKLGAQYALTVGGKKMTYQTQEADETGKSGVRFAKNADHTDIFAVDDVKVYEALPKDEGEDKDEKGKKKK